MSVGEACTQCWVGALQLHEGMLVCDVCGSIHQASAAGTHALPPPAPLLLPLPPACAAALLNH